MVDLKSKISFNKPMVNQGSIIPLRQRRDPAKNDLRFEIGLVAIYDALYLV